MSTQLLAASGGIVERLRRRPLLRLILFFVVLIAVDIGVQVASAYVRKAAPPTVRGVLEVASGVALGAAMISTYRWLVGRIEKRAPDELTPGGFLGWTASGFALGVALFGAVMAILAMLRVAHFAGFNSASGLGHVVGVGIASSVGEEIVFRGAVYRLLEEGLGTTVAVALSALLFGLLHAANPGAGLMGATTIALESGVFLALTYSATRNLWLPIWLHFGWSFAEGGIFGTAISGHEYVGLVTTTLRGPDGLTGGRFGPEASLVALGISFLASLAFGVATLRRRRWIVFHPRPQESISS